VAPNAQVKMKAMVASRLLMGHFDSIGAFEDERATANNIHNRRIARGVTAQIGRDYGQLRSETKKFLDENFKNCGSDELARLCDAIPSSGRIYLRFDEFQRDFFPVADRIRSRFPVYAHVSISVYGLQFEFPEHHFFRDLDSALSDLGEVRARIRDFVASGRNPKRSHQEVGNLIARDKFLSRSIISATFSLVEAFISGLFYTAIETKRIGAIDADSSFIDYARTKESAPLGARIERVIRFISIGREDASMEPFLSLIKVGKRYRDAIHHTTPFARKGLDAGERLSALYEINGDVALECVVLATRSILTILKHLMTEDNVIAEECRNLQQIAFQMQSIQMPPVTPT
jgi:hypothetical protein